MSTISWNRTNKTLIVGSEVDDFLEDTNNPTPQNNVFTIMKPICQRVVIVLEEGQNLEGIINVPVGTSVLIVTPHNIDTSSIRAEYIFDNHIQSRTYGTQGNVTVKNSGSSFNKNTHGNIKNKEVAENVRNQETEWNVLNEATGWNVWNLKTTGEVIDNRGNWGNITNSDSFCGLVWNSGTTGDVINSNTFWNISNQLNRGDVVNYLSWGDIKNKFTWWRVVNILTWGDIENDTRYSAGWGVTHQDTVGETIYSSDSIAETEAEYLEPDGGWWTCFDWDDEVPF